MLALEAAVDFDYLAIYEGGIISSKEESYCSDIFRLTYPLDWAVVYHALQNCRTAYAIDHCSVDGSRSDSIDPDFRTKLPCHGLGKTSHCVLGRNVCCETMVSSERSNGSDVDDNAFALGLHDRSYELAELKCGVYVNSEYSVPLLHAYILQRGHAEHACIIYEYIHCAVSFYGFVYDLIAESEVRSISENVDGFISCCLDLIYDSLCTSLIPAHNYYLCTLLCEKDCSCSSHT